MQHDLIAPSGSLLALALDDGLCDISDCRIGHAEPENDGVELRLCDDACAASPPVRDDLANGDSGAPQCSEERSAPIPRTNYGNISFCHESDDTVKEKLRMER
jgi:hypothetical protein